MTGEVRLRGFSGDYDVSVGGTEIGYIEKAWSPRGWTAYRSTGDGDVEFIRFKTLRAATEWLVERWKERKG